MNDRGALLLVTVFMAGNVVLQAPIGLLADRHGRLLFLWGGTLYAFCSQGVALLGGRSRLPICRRPTRCS